MQRTASKRTVPSTRPRESHSARARLRTGIGASFAAVLAVLGAACSSNGPTAEDARAWQAWTDQFVGVVCAHDESCGTAGGAACSETGYAAAEKAQCDAAVEFYVDNREKLEQCLHSYPTSCAIGPDAACPVIKGHAFETICK